MMTKSTSFQLSWKKMRNKINIFIKLYSSVKRYCHLKMIFICKQNLDKHQKKQTYITEMTRYDWPQRYMKVSNKYLIALQ